MDHLKSNLLQDDFSGLTDRGTVTPGATEYKLIPINTSPHRVNTPTFDRDEIRIRLEALLDSIDLKKEISSIERGFRFIFRRKKVHREFVALCVALWKLALEQSFPTQCDEFYAHFLETSPALGSDKEKEAMLARVEEYNKLMAEKKLEDFTPVSLYLSRFFSPKEDPKTLQLKISLAIRRLYKVIFDYLI